MDDRQPGDVPRLWRELPPQEDYSQGPYPSSSLSGESQWEADPYTWRDRLAGLTPTQQLGYGCIAVILVSTMFLYCVGASTFLVRPIVLGHVAPTSTPFTLPTLAPTPTQVAQPTFIIPLPSPRGTMAPTPTQAPLPTLAPPTLTPTYDPYNPYTPTRKPGVNGTLEPNSSGATPTRKPGAPTVRP